MYYIVSALYLNDLSSTDLKNNVPALHVTSGKKFSHTTIGPKILHGLFKALLKARDFSSLKQDKHVICLLNKLSRHV